MHADPRTDQHQAALAEAYETMVRLAPVLDGEVRTELPMPDWIAAAIRRHNESPKVSCPHVHGPGQYFGAFWRPGVIACRSCARDGALSPRDHHENWSCDACHAYSPNRISIAAVQLGTYIVWAGLCRSCRDSMD